jgi:crotonobetainyl-CoA:carnitine CoA-transferase CaiB-like acyl-CoA transferase
MYDLLSDIRVLEVSLYETDMLGGHLADLGAEVLKIEEPPAGGGVRFRPTLHALDRRINRGKKSVFLNLKETAGRAALQELAKQCHIVVNGLRASAGKRFGFDYETISSLNPSVVYCLLNGTGSTGPYQDMPMHGLGFDAFAGLAPPVMGDDGLPRLPRQSAIGMFAGPMFATIGVLAALHRATATGESQYVEVAELDAAVVWRGAELDTLLNSAGPLGDGAPRDDALRYSYYPTQDEQYVLFMATDEKFWRNFCTAVGREDLYEPGNRPQGQDPTLDARTRQELAELFLTRTRAEWAQFFMEADVAGVPAYLGADVIDDPHVQTRDLFYAREYPGEGELTLVGTCINVGGAEFRPPATPAVGEHTEEVLSTLLGYDADTLERLRNDGVI